MEYYFSGTIERIIFENPSSFFRILLLDISDTDAEDFDDFEIIVTGTMADIMEGEDYTFWGSWSIILNTENNSKSVAMNVPNPLARAWWNIFPAITSKELVSKRLKKSWTSMGTIPLTKFWKLLKN